MPEAVSLDARVVDELDRRLILATQAGLPLVARPYHQLASELGIEAAEVQARLAAMIGRGVIRRIGAVPNHYALGYVANGMTVWDVDDGRIGELGARIGALAYVSHCYRRPRRLPDWRYNLFAMVHARTREEVEVAALEMAALLGEACRARDILYSSRILKKSGLRLTGAG